MSKEEIGSQIKAYLETELLTEEAGNIENTTELISTGVLDSISALTLVTFLEDTFDIQIKAREVGIDYMNTVDDIAGLVIKKQSA